jgi:unsaturated chondroitin disaccharide hydrolase
VLPEPRFEHRHRGEHTAAADIDSRPKLTDTWCGYLEAAGREIVRALQWEPTAFPHFTEDGQWRLLSVEARSRWDGDVYYPGNWTAGFWFGMCWLRGVSSGDDTAAVLALGRLDTLVTRAEDSTTQDLGFLFQPSFVLAESIGLIDTELVWPAHAAARMIGHRFNHAGRYLQALGPIGDARFATTSTIDTMMNLPLLWWASARAADPRLFEMARQHARTSARLLLREDGSSYQLSEHDPVSGALHGRSPSSAETACQSRGQAWAACGFAWAYAATGEPELLAAAERALAYFARILPEDGVASWDLADVNADGPRDSSASAIAALALVILGRFHPDPAHRVELDGQGADLLIRLGVDCLNRDERVHGILLHSCYSKPHGWGVDGATGWGDFYYGLALALATGQVTAEVALGFSPTQLQS